jgi:hypothetical protein
MATTATFESQPALQAPPHRAAAASHLHLSMKTRSAVLLSLAYALLVVFFPWDAIIRSPFSDFDDNVFNINYLHTFNNVNVIERYGISSYLELFTNEALWYELTRWLTNITGDAAVALRILSFFMLFVWSYFLIKRVRYAPALLFLFNPTAIDVAMSSIRNGLAWSFFMVGISSRWRYLRAALFVTGILIHSSTLALVIIYYATQFASRIIKTKTILIGGIGLGVFIGLALSIGGSIVLGAIGDRRAGADYVVGASFLQASVWGILLCLQCLSGRRYVRENIFVISVLAWYLAMNPFIPWSYRVWSSLLPVIAVSALKLPRLNRQVFISLYSGYLVVQYLYWTKLFYYWHSA